MATLRRVGTSTVIIEDRDDSKSIWASLEGDGRLTIEIGMPSSLVVGRFSDITLGSDFINKLAEGAALVGYTGGD